MGNSELSYLYLSGRVQTLRAALLNWDTVARMAAAESYAEALRTARENGGEEDVSAVLEKKKAQLFAELSRARAGKTIVNLFRWPYDCHNAKVLLKTHLTGQENGGALSPCGAVDTEQLAEAVRGETAAALPQWLRTGIAEAKRLWTDSRSPQLVDAALDRAAFAGRRAAARESGSGTAVEYMTLQIDGINLQTLLRMKNARNEVVEELLLPGGSVSPGRLLDSRAAGNLAAVFSQPQLRTAAESGSAAQAEDALTALLSAFARRCGSVPYGAETLLGFLLQLELYQGALRMVLTLQHYGHAKECRERLEVLYG